MIGITLIPFVLLVREDLGTALVLLIVCFIILFAGGAARRWLISTVVVAIVGVVALLGLNGTVADLTGGDVKLIKDYQMSRLLVFVDQDNPAYADDAYNLNQAKIAVGSGEVVGKGWGNATQSSGGFLPESATDFIFCVLAEQFGFFGSFILIVLYLALLVVALSIGLRSSGRRSVRPLALAISMIAVSSVVIP
jgi:rod shape determining protein RodA